MENTVQELLILLDQNEKLSCEEFAQIIAKQKPYLIEIERIVEEINYGDLDLKLSVRAGVVEKMVITKGAIWLRNKVDLK